MARYFTRYRGARIQAAHREMARERVTWRPCKDEGMAARNRSGSPARRRGANGGDHCRCKDGGDIIRCMIVHEGDGEQLAPSHSKCTTSSCSSARQELESYANAPGLMGGWQSCRLPCSGWVRDRIGLRRTESVTVMRREHLCLIRFFVFAKKPPRRNFA